MLKMKNYRNMSQECSRSNVVLETIDNMLKNDSVPWLEVSMAGVPLEDALIWSVNIRRSLCWFQRCSTNCAKFQNVVVSLPQLTPLVAQLHMLLNNLTTRVWYFKMNNTSTAEYENASEESSIISYGITPEVCLDNTTFKIFGHDRLVPTQGNVYVVLAVCHFISHLLFSLPLPFST